MYEWEEQLGIKVQSYIHKLTNPIRAMDTDLDVGTGGLIIR
jgi:hypothetical protein